tara:strand:+ start:602 stop:1705 length:1104 start_codon:yes stop_codon:yes gene_type:complete
VAERKIIKYTPGFNIHDVQKKYNIKNVIKLASNENPYISKNVENYIAKSKHDLNLYPDSIPLNLLTQITKTIGNMSKPENIIIGNGSNEILEFISRASLNSSSEVIIPKHSFLVYEIICKLLRAKVVTSLPDRSRESENYLGIDIEDVLKKITKNTKLIFIANPGNPTGTYLKLSVINNFLECIPKRISVIVDEAYYEYLEPVANKSAVSLLKKHKNLFVTRSLSKIYGLASLRIGYGISSSKNIQKLQEFKQPFNTNMFAQKAALLALKDKKFIKMSKDNNSMAMKKLTDTLNKLSITYLGTNCNFLTFKAGANSQKLFLYLLKKGIIVRPLTNYKLPDYLRVSLGKPRDNQKFIKHLKIFYSEKI